MTNRKVVERFMRALVDNDFDAQDALIHPDYLDHYPQSGEVIRGVANRRAIVESYPGRAEAGVAVSSERVSGAGEQWLPSPHPLGWGITHIGGANDEFTTAGTVRYPNGETWHIVALFTVRDGKIWRQTTYFAPPFEPPEWRAPYTEQRPASD